MTEKKDREVLRKERDEIREALEILFVSEYFNKRKLYWENFVRGIVFGAGGVIGATIFIAFLVWVLSWFDSISFINDAKETIEQGQGSR